MDGPHGTIALDIGEGVVRNPLGEVPSIPSDAVSSITGDRIGPGGGDR